ncbi:hypothetical protein EHS86_18040, partial [Erwinia amylovora]
MGYTYTPAASGLCVLIHMHPRLVLARCPFLPCQHRPHFPFTRLPYSSCLIASFPSSPVFLCPFCFFSFFFLFFFCLLFSFFPLACGPSEHYLFLIQPSLRFHVLRLIGLFLFFVGVSRSKMISQLWN